MEGQKKGKRRLQPEAYTILNDYFENVSKWPDPEAQEDLAERVRRIKGCEFYTARQVYAYFANNRSKIRSAGKDFALPTGDAPRRGRRKSSRGDLGPAASRSLSDSGVSLPTQTSPDSVIRKLNVLLDDDPDPSPEVVEVWADSLGNGVVAEHILTYAFLRRATTCQGLEPQEPSESPAAAAPPPPQRSSSSSPVPPAASAYKEPAELEHPAPPTDVPPAARPPSTNLAQLEHPRAVPPPSQPPSESVPVLAGSGNEHVEGAPAVSTSTPSSGVSIPPLARDTHAQAVGPEALVHRVRAALLEADVRGTRDSPKTFVDFARWLEAHNGDRGAALHTPTPTTSRALQRA